MKQSLKSGIPEFDEAVEQFENGEINFVELTNRLWNKAYKIGQTEQCNIADVSGSLPTSEELQEIVVKIAYSQQGEEQSDDCYAKMGMLHEFISKYVNGNDR